MFKKNFLNKKLFVLSIVGSFIPGTWFTAYRTDIDLYVIKILFITTLIVYLYLFFFFNYKDFSKENIIDIFHLLYFSH